MRFRDNMEGVTPILSAVPPDSTREGKDDARRKPGGPRRDRKERAGDHRVGGNPRQQWPGLWMHGTHFHFNWAQNDFRKTILNSILWIAHVEVPQDGVQSKTPTVDELLENLDPKKEPKDFSKEAQQQIEEMNRPQAAAGNKLMIRHPRHDMSRHPAQSDRRSTRSHRTMRREEGEEQRQREDEEKRFLATDGARMQR